MANRVSIRVLPALLMAVFMMATGCAPSDSVELPVQRAASDATEQPTQEDLQTQMEVAGRFALAAHLHDVDTMLSLIDPAGTQEHAAELGAMEGTPLLAESILVAYDPIPGQPSGTNLAMRYRSLDAVATISRGSVMVSCIGNDSAESYYVTFVRNGSHWLIKTIDERPAVVTLLRLSPAGEECLRNLEELTLAAGAYRARSQEYVAPQSPDELVPDLLGVLPSCPSGGEYSIDEDALAHCSRHGEVAGR